LFALKFIPVDLDDHV